MTPQEFVDLTKAVKGRMVQLISGVLIPVPPAVVGEKVPKILDRLTIDRDYKAWANKLKSDRHVVDEAGVEVQKVHAFMVYYQGMQDYPDKTVRSAPFRLQFGVDSFYQHDPGKGDDDPEERHNAEISLVAWTLYGARPFGVDFVKSVISFRERRGLTRMGDYLVRQSMATVIIELEPVAIPRSI